MKDSELISLTESLPGWCTPEKAMRLAALVVELRAVACVELGVFGGRSLVAIAAGLARLHAVEPVALREVVGIDPYESKASLEGENSAENDAWWSALDYAQILSKARLGLDRGHLGNFARIARGKSLDLAPTFRDGIDLLHQDSNHSELVSCAEVEAWADKLRPGGLWVQDDMNWPTTKRSGQLLRSRGFTLVETHGPGHDPHWGVYRKAE